MIKKNKLLSLGVFNWIVFLLVLMMVKTDMNLNLFFQRFFGFLFVINIVCLLISLVLCVVFFVRLFIHRMNRRVVVGLSLHVLYLIASGVFFYKLLMVALKN